MNKESIINNDPKSPVSEAFRALRTNMQYLKNSSSKQTIVTTSTVQGEGKTWITVNLAVAFAQLGKKTLLIDSDMRVPRVHRIFEMDQYPGLSNYLSKISQTGRNEDYTFESVLKRSEIKNLTLILAGSIPPNPSELLSSGRLQELIDEAKEKFDVIIFDGTPALLVTDAIIISRSVDSTIIVTSKRKTKLDDLKEVKKRIENAGGHIAGVILNRVKESSKKYESKYYYSSDKRSRNRHRHTGKHVQNDMFEESEEIKRALKNEFRSEVNPDAISDIMDGKQGNQFKDIIQDENLIVFAESEESHRVNRFADLYSPKTDLKVEPVVERPEEKVEEKNIKETTINSLDNFEIKEAEKVVEDKAEEIVAEKTTNKHMAEEPMLEETVPEVEESKSILSRIKKEDTPKKTSSRKTKVSEDKKTEKKKAEDSKKKTTKTAEKKETKAKKAKETKTTKTAKATKATKATKTTKTTKTSKATKEKKDSKDSKEKEDFSEVKKTIGKKILDLFTEEVDEEEAKNR